MTSPNNLTNTSPRMRNSTSNDVRWERISKHQRNKATRAFQKSDRREWRRHVDDMN
jgi:hypothetical protein